ncbi:hypothetical protein [Flagellimonas sp. 2504JD4-2]
MRFLTLLFVLVLTASSCKSQTKSEPKTITVDEFNWTITIPENFVQIEEEAAQKIQKRGLDALGETVGEEVINRTIPVFFYQNGFGNMMECNWQPYDSDVDGEYLETNKLVQEAIFQTYELQLPDAPLDSVSSVQIIDDLEFQKFEVVIGLPNGNQLKGVTYNRLFDNRDFTFTVMYVDKEIGQKIMDSFTQSNFE